MTEEEIIKYTKTLILNNLNYHGDERSMVEILADISDEALLEHIHKTIKILEKAKEIIVVEKWNTRKRSKWWKKIH